MSNITTVAGRSMLEPRREPYWRKEGAAYLGFGAGPSTWVGRIRVDGKQQYQALGVFDDYRKAVKALQAWLELRDAGVTDATSTIACACESYVKHLRTERGDGPANDALGRLERRVTGRAKASRKKPLKANALARVKLAELRLHHLKTWRATLPAETRAQKASSQRDLNTLKAALNFAHTEQMVASDAAWTVLPGYDNIDAGNTAREYLSIEQRRRLLAAAEPAVRDLLEGLALLGARPVELARATVADFDARSATLVLWSMKGRPAIKRERSVPLKAFPGALALVRRLVKDKLLAAPIWTRADGKAWAHSDHDELVREAATAAGLQSITAYSLRHSFIADAVGSGAPIDTVARVVGTSAAMIERTYGKLVQDHAVQAFALMARL